MKRLLRCLPALIVASLILLAGYSHVQIEQQARAMDRQILDVSWLFIMDKQIPSYLPGEEHAFALLHRHPLRHHPNTHALIMLFHADDMQQPLHMFPAIYRDGRLEIWEPYSHLEPWVRRRAATVRFDGTSISSSDDGLWRRSRIIRSEYARLETEDAGEFIFVWAVEAFPLRVALRQLIPVYIMTALLLTALWLTKKKHSKTQEENPDAQ